MMYPNLRFTTASCLSSSSPEGSSYSFICLTMDFSRALFSTLPASISYWESPITIMLVRASLSINPSISLRDRKAAFFHSAI